MVPLRPASIEGHFSGPGLSWPELPPVAGSAPPGAEGVLDPGTRLPLLLPAFGDADVPTEEAVRRIADALTGAGMAAEAAPGAAVRLLDHPFWDGPTWTPQGPSPLSGSSRGAEPAPAVRRAVRPAHRPARPGHHRGPGARTGRRARPAPGGGPGRAERQPIAR
ncbi:hypothetical protein [Streptomyces sp. NPDC048200]|uniref:hypothetical protein n=1 Tax=Streptomyces sp. NPDC048200 TaxID=3365512 RepID=UPI0037118298